MFTHGYDSAWQALLASKICLPPVHLYKMAADMSRWEWAGWQMQGARFCLGTGRMLERRLQHLIYPTCTYGM